MFVRLVILVVLAVLVYRVARKWFGTVQYHRSGPGGAPPETAADEMIKDPQCGVYFPRRQAVALTERDRTRYFCSAECRDRYLASHSSGSPR